MLASYFLISTPLDGASLAAALMVGGGVALYARPPPPAHPAYELLPAKATDAYGGAAAAEAARPQVEHGVGSGRDRQMEDTASRRD